MLVPHAVFVDVLNSLRTLNTLCMIGTSLYMGNTMTLIQMQKQYEQYKLDC